MKQTYKNYFGAKTAAERYAKGRPRFHSFVVEKIKDFFALEENFESALDVGCGTGLSSVALKNIAERVVGVDISEEMINQAEKIEGIEYFLASAENLPFGAAEFDVITISQAIHWVDKSKFFAEADRVLKPDSMIVAYDNLFQGKMADNPAFNDWYKNEFLENYPVPPRGKRAFERESENATDFVLRHEEFNDNLIELSADELVDYLITITNVIAHIENGSQSVEEVRDWLTKGVSAFFAGQRKSLAFINPIWFLQRNY